MPSGVPGAPQGRAMLRAFPEGLRWGTQRSRCSCLGPCPSVLRSVLVPAYFCIVFSVRVTLAVCLRVCLVRGGGTPVTGSLNWGRGRLLWVFLFVRLVCLCVGCEMPPSGIRPEPLPKKRPSRTLSQRSGSHSGPRGAGMGAPRSLPWGYPRPSLSTNPFQSPGARLAPACSRKATVSARASRWVAAKWRSGKFLQKSILRVGRG